MSTKIWNVGVVGYGFSAKIFHIPFINHVHGMKVYGIVQRTPKPDDDAEADYLGVKLYRTAEDMMKDPAIEVVIVTTAPASHFALSKLALEAGKHVVCEKPFTPTSREADVLIALARECGKLLSIYHNIIADRRWDADYVTLSKLINNGSLGRITEFETHFDHHLPTPPDPEAHKWRNKIVPGASAVYDLGVHLLDQALHLFGPPTEITGFIGSDREVNDSGFDDSFTILLHYTKGLKVTAKGTVVSPEDEQLRFWVRGDTGSFKKFHLDIQEHQLRAGIMPSESIFGLEPSERYGMLMEFRLYVKSGISLTFFQGTLTNFHDGNYTKKVVSAAEPLTYTQFYRQLVAALAGDGEVPVSGEDGRRVIHLLELAYESSRTRRTLSV
ncbi:unnamed protein product [Penicillium olsonii]|nr:unnamed protein product [Penicillium olsonii]